MLRLKEKQKRYKKEYWVHPIISQRTLNGQFYKIHADLRLHPKEFFNRTDFPNCIGAVDDKHIRLKKPENSGSQFYNYKNFFSTILLGVVDADYCFTAIAVGSCGSIGDSNVLIQKFKFCSKTTNQQIKHS